MKKKSVLAAASVAVFCLASFAAPPSNDAQLWKEAKISKENAERIALAKMPQGKVKIAEIEREKGHLVWSFDIAKPNTQDITEVLVDAKTGAIIYVQTEFQADQARENAADRKHGALNQSAPTRSA